LRGTQVCSFGSDETDYSCGLIDVFRGVKAVKRHSGYRVVDPVQSDGMFHRVLMGLGALACTAGLLPALGQSVDFRNFTFPFPDGEFHPVPSKMTWMSLNINNAVTLVNGRYDFDKEHPSMGPAAILDRVLYGYLTSAKQPDAVVVLSYHTGGTAYWDYVYAFSFASDEPKLLGWFRAGSRADFGLYRVEVGNRSLIVDLFDPARRIADCCSNGFVRTHYDFRNGYFIQRGPQEVGAVEEAKPESASKSNQ
jgi:hypothetical protein